MSLRESSGPPIRLALAMGQSARQIRLDAGLALEDISNGMRDLGFRWSTSRVVELEAGKVAPTLGVMLGLVRVLSEARTNEPELTLRDLVPSNKMIELAPGVEAWGSAIRDALDGSGTTLLTMSEMQRKTDALVQIRAGAGEVFRGGHWTVELMSRTSISFGLADERAARTLGLSLPEFLTVATSLWGQSLDDERFERATADASPQHLGRITRLLLQEAREYVASKGER